MSASAKIAGMVAFAQARKLDNRDRIMDAAATLFRERGYLPVSIEDVAASSGVSRMTFYRHFSNKAALAEALFARAATDALPQFLSIREKDFTNPTVVYEWLTAAFAVDQENRNLLRAFIQANVVEQGFSEMAHGFIAQIIMGLGREIRAFSARQDVAAERRRWLQGWLLIYEILDQSNHAARGLDPSCDPMVIDILADRFSAFVAV